MANRKVTGDIRSLEALCDQVPAIKKKGFGSAEFARWLAKATEVLENSLGPQGSIVDEFKSIRFEVSQGALQALGHRAKGVAITSSQGRKITRIDRPKPDPAQAQAKHFDRAMSEASEVLLQGKLQLRKAASQKERSED